MDTNSFRSLRNFDYIHNNNICINCVFYGVKIGLFFLALISYRKYYVCNVTNVVNWFIMNKLVSLLLFPDSQNINIWIFNFKQ